FERVAAVSGEDVAGDGTHFEADEGGEEFLCGSEDAHAGGGEQNERQKLGRIKIFRFEIGLRRKNYKKNDGAKQQVEEEAKGVRENQAGKAGAVVPRRNDGKGSAAESADEAEEREEVAVLEKRLEQHDEDAESAPDQLGKNELHVSEGGH